MLHLDLMLKNNELCLVGRSQERSGLHEAGLFVRDTRFLSHFETRILGLPLEILSVQQISDFAVNISAANPELMLADGRRLQNQSLFVEQRIELTNVMQITTTIRNYDGNPVSLPLTFEIGADFRDMFDVRGMTPMRRPSLRVPVATTQDVNLVAIGSDSAEIATFVSVSPSPDSIETMDHAEDESHATISYDIELAHGDELVVNLTLEPRPVGAPLVAVDTYNPDFTSRFRVSSDSPELDAFIHQSDRDLALLYTSFPEGNITAAGIPWFITPFGRDSLIVGLQTMHAYPGRVASTLRVLAALQGEHDDAWREEEPGKILHEMRYGDMARSGQAPHSPYFGSIDSTPLFVMTFAQHYLWHQDDALFEELLPNVRRALEWIETRGDLDGDGLVEFGAKANDGVHINQQGWKDSFDSLHYADGREAEGPIALVEVQGYVYASYAWLGEAVRERGDLAWAAELTARADRIRGLVEELFWMEDVGFYAQGLDGRKHPIDAISSNPGHLLYCGLPSNDRAARVATMMATTELNCGWGIRTLGESMATYNPLSYHNGSIWPHDSSIAIAGLCQYGHRELAQDLVQGLVELSHFAPSRRLAELYCGIPMEADVAPVNYPVSCIPQAWAAATGLLAIRALLDIRPDPARKTVTVNGLLPSGLTFLVVQGVEAFGQTFTITLEDAGVQIDARTSGTP